MIYVHSINVTPSNVSIKVGEWYYGANATVSPSNATNQNVKWHSSNTSVASVNEETGIIYGRGVGTATIYATAKDGTGLRDSCEVTVTSSKVYVDTVTLSRTSVSLKKGGNYTLTATVCPTNATNKTLAWSSDNENIATVDQYGNIHAVSVGMTYINACSTDGSGAVDSCCVMVYDPTVYVECVKLEPTSISLNVGDTYTLSATVCPTDATNKTLAWSSDNYDIATVDDYGNVCAVAPGMTYINACSTDGNGAMDSCHIVINSSFTYVDTITLDRTSLSLEEGSSYTLTANVCPTNASNKNIMWHSSDSSIVEVSKDGSVVANSVGSAVITAYAVDNSGVLEKCTVTVFKRIPVDSIDIDPSHLTIAVGDSIFLHESICPQDATTKCVTWSSEDANIATVNPESGLVFAQGIGTTTIYATAQDGSEAMASCIVDVVEYVFVQSIVVNPKNITMKIGESATLNATIYPSNANNKSVTWYSTNPSVAEVNEGVVSVKDEGNTTIFATANDGSGKSGCCRIAVKVKIESIKITPERKALNKGESVRLTASVSPTNATNPSVIWRSSDTKVATVKSASGLVIAQDEGTATITAQSIDGSGIVGTCMVEVYDGESTISRSHYGSLEYKDEIYDIFVPNHLQSTEEQESWTTINTQYISNAEFDLFKFIAGFELPDEKTGLNAAGDFTNEIDKSVLIEPGVKAKVGAASLFAGILNSAYDSINKTFVKFNFQKTPDNKKRVIIEAGSLDAQRMFSEYATNIPDSAYYSNSGNVLAQTAITNMVANKYEEITGNEQETFTTYDLEVTVDKRHKDDDGAVSYLWINKNGEITETPIVYPKDKVAFGVREGFWVFSSFVPFATVDLTATSIASTEFQELFYRLS